MCPVGQLSAVSDLLSAKAPEERYGAYDLNLMPKPEHQNLTKRLIEIKRMLTGLIQKLTTDR